jgi:hypothetical protein
LIVLLRLYPATGPRVIINLLSQFIVRATPPAIGILRKIIPSFAGPRSDHWKALKRRNEKTHKDTTTFLSRMHIQ